MKHREGKKEFPCIENLIEMHYRGSLIRIWVDKKELQYNFDYERKLVNEIWNQEFKNIVDVMRFIGAQPNVNAVSLGDKIEGALVKYSNIIYTVDFQDDPRG